MSNTQSDLPHPESSGGIRTDGSRHNHGFTRLASKDTFHTEGHDGAEQDVADTHQRSRNPGLTISSDHGRRSPTENPRVSIVFSHASSSPKTEPPGTGDPLIGSPGFRQMYQDETEYHGAGDEFFGEETRTAKTKPSSTSLHSSYQRFLNLADNEPLNRNSAASIKSAYESDFVPPKECPSHRSIYQSRTNYLAIAILVLSVYSTVFSGIFLVLALKGPRYGKRIAPNGPLKPTDASLLTAIIAKTIELSFVTAFVSFLGQVLSRRAFMKQGKGVSLAEFSMRNWIMQPGSMITHWESVRYAGLTILGIVSLVATIVATLYTSASDALVQPRLKFGPDQVKVFSGMVKTSFANPDYLASQCSTPIRNDPTAGGQTCLQIEHAAQGFQNYQKYLSFWDDISSRDNGTTDLKLRPNGFGLLYTNTSVNASWVEVVDMANESKDAGRIINNVSLAMPHAGVFSAAHDERNSIVQPQEVGGLGKDGYGVYSMKASVPNPVINVLCANMKEDELKPIIYTSWPNATRRVQLWPTQMESFDTDDYLNSTVVDDLFGWGEKYKQKPPIFYKYPLGFNTILNHTGPYGKNAIYLLGRGDPEEQDNYFLCSLKVSLTAQCATRYNASTTSGTLEAICEDPPDDMAYINSLSNATSGIPNSDWPNIGNLWGNSISLNAGLVDGNASNARLLTQLMLKEPSLDPNLPSPAEALAVMGGCTLLMASVDSPFVQFWNNTETVLSDPEYQSFRAKLRSQEYASGGAGGADRGFFVVLFTVFITNVFVLGYFFLHKGLVTDFSEPPNMFTLAVNSPPSYMLAGSCGGGPEGEQYRVSWFVNTEGQHLFMESGGEPKGWRWRGKKTAHSQVAHSQVAEEGVELGGAIRDRVSRHYETLSKRRSVL